MLTKRLREIVDRVPQCDTVLDVGCDHGIVAFSIMQTGKAKKVLLSDISGKCLEKARKLIENDYPNSEFFVSNGVESVDSDFDFCIIAGMGGLEISKIVRAPKIDNALLQPMNNVGIARQNLVEVGFEIVSDEIVFDEKFYNIIVVKRGKDSLTEKEIIFGRTNLLNKTDDFVKYLKFELKKNLEFYNDVPKGERLVELTRYIELIKELLNEN